VPLFHLRDDGIGDVFGAKRTGLFTEDDLERHVEQDVAELLLDRVAIVAGQCLIQLQDLFDEVRTQGGTRLLAIPRTAVTQVAHEFHDASKR